MTEEAAPLRHQRCRAEISHVRMRAARVEQSCGGDEGLDVTPSESSFSPTATCSIVDRTREMEVERMEASVSLELRDAAQTLPTISIVSSSTL